MKLDNTLFWHDAGDCHWCGRKTDSMTEGHDGMCPVPLLVIFEAENEELRETLNQMTDGRWTAMEIDAAKWRGQEMAKALGGES